MTTSGTGYKLFGSGDILRAAEVNGYLMNQSVMVFETDGTRGALGALDAPGDGQVSYLKGTNVLQVYDTDTGWVTIGLNPDIRDAQIMTFMQAI